MVDEDIGCCATFQKWVIFFVNFVLFIFGIVQMAIACYILAGGSEGLEFASDVEGNDSAVNALLAFGILLAFVSLQGCLGAKRESKCLLWMYAIILLFMIIGQAMVVAVVAVSVKYGDSIFESLWKDLEPDTISDIEAAYQCCSFNGDSTDTWAGDVTEYNQCILDNSFDPMETCWGKFERTIEENYDMVKIVTALIMGTQILIYLITHFVIQSIAEAEGAEAGKIEFAQGAPKY